jgi:hypothetical protein
MVAVLTVLAALPVMAGNGQIKITHAPTPYQGKQQVAVAHATNSNEFQVAVVGTPRVEQRFAPSPRFIHR